jgi:hypothetical protein
MKSRTLTRIAAVTLFAALASRPIRFAAQDQEEQSRHFAGDLGNTFRATNSNSTNDWLIEDNVGNSILQGRCLVYRGLVTDICIAMQGLHCVSRKDPAHCPAGAKPKSVGRDYL